MESLTRKIDVRWTHPQNELRKTQNSKYLVIITKEKTVNKIIKQDILETRIVFTNVCKKFNPTLQRFRARLTKSANKAENEVTMAYYKLSVISRDPYMTDIEKQSKYRVKKSCCYVQIYSNLNTLKLLTSLCVTANNNNIYPSSRGNSKHLFSVGIDCWD